jgi:hypothetical protein
MLGDPQLSFKAKGLLSYLLAQSDEWDVYQSQLADLGPDGEAAVRSGLKELRKRGYMARNTLRNEDGTFRGYEYVIYEQGTESGKVESVESGAGKPETGKSDIGESDTGSSDIGKPQPNNTNSKQDKQQQDEEAPARGEEPDEDTEEEQIPQVIQIWRNEPSTPPLTKHTESVLIGWEESGKIPDPDLFEKVLAEDAAAAKANGGGINMGILLSEYRDQYESGILRPDRQDDPDWSVNEDGERCYKGKPISEMGMTNLAADLPGDGAAGGEPEVSPHG